MLKNILLTTDGSQNSLRGADFALQLAEKYHAHVVILYVVPKLQPREREALSDLGKDVEAIKEKLKIKSADILEQTTNKFKERGISFEAKIETGEDPADTICQEAKNQGIGLIVIGTRGQSEIARFLMGSVSSKVVNHAPCSVLVVR